MSCVCSRTWALFVSFLILTHPKHILHVLKLLFPQPEGLETHFKKKTKTKPNKWKLGFQPNQSTLEAQTIKIRWEVMRPANAASIAVVPPPPLAAWRNKRRVCQHSTFSWAQKYSHVLRKTGLFWQELPETKRFIHARKTDSSIYKKPSQQLPSQLLRAVQIKGTKRFFWKPPLSPAASRQLSCISRQGPPSWSKCPWPEVRHPAVPRKPTLMVHTHTCLPLHSSSCTSQPIAFLLKTASSCPAHAAGTAAGIGCRRASAACT